MVEPLPPHPTLRRRPGPVVLAILDGVGLGSGEEDDAVATARTPTLDALRATCPFVALNAHGVAVGLPSDDDMGNSEVGHNAMGSGRVFDQGAKRVNQAFETGEAFETDVWRGLVAGKTLHLLGLVSDGNVHSHIDHVNRLIAQAASDGTTRLRLHVLTDGRDVGRRTALTWVRPLEEALAAHRAAGRDFRIGSGGGRMLITMDRYEADWSMVERGWRCHVHGEGQRFPSASAAIEALYAADPEADDQHLPTFVVTDEAGAPCGTVADGDSVLFFNFRGDRAIEISRAFEEGDDFAYFDRGARPAVFFAGMMQYDGDRLIPKQFLVAPPAIDRTVGEFLVAAGLRTFACSETQKFGHVTYFFNGNRSGRVDDDLEEYVEIPSDRRPFHERPWMKAAEIADAVVDAIGSGTWTHVRLNFANGDMVGHTGRLEASRLAVEAVDLQLGRLVRAVKDADGILLVTADHGNCDEMWMHKGGKVERDAHGLPMPKTSHTLAKVPFLVYDPRGEVGIAAVEDPGIAEIGGTLLALCGLQPPDDYLPALVAPLEDPMIVDLRSDTVTKPSDAMRRAMASAEVGDDVFGDDPTVKHLEAVSAGRAGKEAALFVPSGTMANQIAIALHTRPGDEVLMEATSHPFNYEAGGAAAISGVQIRPIPAVKGIMLPAEVEARIRPANDHYAPARLLCVEDTSNRGGGTVHTVDQLDALTAVAKKRGLATHLDGARAWNAVVASGVGLDRRAKGFDTITFCFSKGLGAPVGSILCGSRDHIAAARRVRKMLGGGMRQVGILAAACMYALENNIDRLAQDHERARKLSMGLMIEGYDVQLPQTNIIYVKVRDAEALVAELQKRNVRCHATSADSLRLVTHLDVDDAGVDYAIAAFQALKPKD